MAWFALFLLDEPPKYYILSLCLLGTAEIPQLLKIHPELSNPEVVQRWKKKNW
jgi:hypothetical protein